jgi:hypothetical protein
MNDLGLVASLAGSIIWPVTVAGIVFFFRLPLINLIGRLKSAQVAGQSFEFGPQLEEAEEKADVAVSDSVLVPETVEIRPPERNAEEKVPPPVSGGQVSPDEVVIPSKQDQDSRAAFDVAEQAQSGVSNLAREAEANPSFTILRAWENLAGVLADYIGAALPGKPRGSNRLAFLNELQRIGELTPSYLDAVQDVRQLRNAVAHGQHKPTPGEAIAYAETIGKLVFVATFQLQLYIERQGRPASLRSD